MLVKWEPELNRSLTQHFHFSTGEWMAEVGLTILGPSIFSASLRFADMGWRRLEFTLWLIAAAVVVYAGFSYGHLSYSRSVWIESLAAGVLILIAGVFCWSGVQHQANREQRVLAVLCLALPYFAMHDTAVYFGWVEGHTMLQASLGMVFVLNACGSIVWRFLFRAHQFEISNQLLHRNVLNARARLQKTVGEQHRRQLALAREQERSLLWQNIHDGFSTTVDGVIAKLDAQQADVVRTAQLLKLMRDDLRFAIRIGTTKTDLTIDSVLADLRRQWVDKLAYAGTQLHWTVGRQFDFVAQFGLAVAHDRA